MALIRTPLTAPIKPGDLVWAVGSTAVGFPPVGQIVNTPAQMLQVDDEIAFLVQVLSPGVIQVRSRGSDGTVADSHDVNAQVITSQTINDFPSVANIPGNSTQRPIWATDIESYGQSGAIPAPTQDTKAFLAGLSGMAMTLSAPSLAAFAVELVISSQTAFAHQISAPGLFDTGVVGSPFSTATFAAQVGASMWLVAQNGLWNVVNSVGVTFS